MIEASIYLMIVLLIVQRLGRDQTQEPIVHPLIDWLRVFVFPGEGETPADLIRRFEEAGVGSVNAQLAIDWWNGTEQA